MYRIWTLTLSVHHSGDQTRRLLLHDVIASLTASETMNNWMDLFAKSCNDYSLNLLGHIRTVSCRTYVRTYFCIRCEIKRKVLATQPFPYLRWDQLIERFYFWQSYIIDPICSCSSLIVNVAIANIFKRLHLFSFQLNSLQSLNYVLKCWVLAFLIGFQSVDAWNTVDKLYFW